MLVSISCTTYNHAPFIRKCIEGFLIQRTNFPFEILIHDDASTDGTADIIREYAAKYPEIIFPVLQHENQYRKGVRGMMATFNFPRAKGKYIALCEGDDYWTDPDKLQKQYDLMEQRQDISFCFHQCMVSGKEQESLGLTNAAENKQQFTLSDIISRDWFIMTCSIFIRKAIFDAPDWLFKSTNGDYAMQLICAAKGDAYLLNEVMGVYQKHGGGLSDQLLGMERGSNMLCVLLDQFNGYTAHKYEILIKEKQRKLKDRLVEEYAYALLSVKPYSKQYWADYKRILKYGNFKNLLHLKYLIKYLIPFSSKGH